jgi:hypothetical protein
MMNKATFSNDEWVTLLKAPGLAGMYVAASSPSGPVGAIKESMALTRQVMEARQSKSADELIGAVVSDLLTTEGRHAANIMEMLGKPVAEVQTVCLQALSQSRDIVAAKVGSDPRAWSDWLAQIGKHVAEAAKEGGFMGIGGTQVNDAERTALAQIDKALGRA